jgi:NAD(P)-dependent dehydrogenase (short-subunit alcohol dehydrogenase family)
VTGAASGIGRATALELSRRGYRVAAADRDEAAAKRTAAEAQDGLGVGVDVREERSVDACAAAVVEWAGRVDLLVNSAGIVGATGTVLETPVDVWDDVFAVNVRGIFLCSRAVLPGMIERRRGVIVNVASIAGLVAIRNRAAYCASKGAAIAITRSMAIDHVNQGIRVNCVCPGSIDTPWVDRLVAASDDPEATRAEIVERQPIGRLGTPEEIAAGIAYLASDEAAFATGTALILDGGLTAA